MTTKPYIAARTSLTPADGVFGSLGFRTPSWVARAKRMLSLEIHVAKENRNVAIEGYPSTAQ